jgi:hypothetical protein
VLVPFQENVFAFAVSQSTSKWPPFLADLLNHLVPAQLKAIRRLIVQHTAMSKCLRPALTRLKGLESLQYVLVGSELYLGGFGISEFFDSKGRLGDFGLPPSCDVQIRIRRLLQPGRVEQIYDVLMMLTERARWQILHRSRPGRNPPSWMEPSTTA